MTAEGAASPGFASETGPIGPEQGDPPGVSRRPPFADNPRVGMRGQQARQHILEAALQLFGKAGYHDTTVTAISGAVGCSSAAFYQYFSGKEDVFWHLAGQVGRQLGASAELLPPVSPGPAGKQMMKEWVERQFAIYGRYEPVFRHFAVAAESDERVRTGAARNDEQIVALVRSKMSATTVAGRYLDGVIAMLMEGMVRLPRVAGALEEVPPYGYRPPDGLVAVCSDLVYRVLFGDDGGDPAQRPGAQPGDDGRSGTVRRVPTRSASRERVDRNNPTVDALLAAGRHVLIGQGYHAARIRDIVSAAGVSQGTFYRYFDNKDHLVQFLTASSLQKVGDAFSELGAIGALDGSEAAPALRSWLRRYAGGTAAELTLARVWFDSVATDPQRRVDASAAVAWAQKCIRRFLEPRSYVDLDSDVLMLVALLDALAMRASKPGATDAAALIIERGFPLGAPASPERKELCE